MSAKKETTGMNLESKMELLEETIAKMEEESISMEDSFALYQQGVKLLKECNEEVDAIEKKVLLINDNGETNEF